MHNSPNRPSLSTGVLTIVLAISLLAIWWVIVRPPRLPASNPPKVPEIPPPEVTIPPGLSKSEFYRRDLVPLLNDETSRNQKAVEHAVVRLHQEFETFRAGVPGFTADVTSWGTRGGQLTRMIKDKWKNFWKRKDDPDSEEVKNYMLEKFEAHIMSRDRIKLAVKGAVDQFGEDVTASRNRLLLEAKLALSTQDVHLAFPMPDFDSFQRKFNEYIAESLQVQAAYSVENAVVTFVASGVASWAAEQLFARIITLLTEEALLAGVEAAAAGGGVTAGGGALGGAAGWLGGPAGAVIGIGAGVAFGALVDWWMTDSFKAQLTEQLTAYLNNLERDLIDGVAPRAGRPQQVGLRDSCRTAVTRVDEIHRQAMLNTLEAAK